MGTPYLPTPRNLKHLMKHKNRHQTASILLKNPTLAEVANRYRQLLKTRMSEEIDIVYTGQICDVLTDAQVYDSSGSLIVDAIYPFDDLIALYLHDANDIVWFVKPV